MNGDPDPRRPRIVVSVFDHAAYRGGGQLVVRRIIDRLSRDYEVVLVTTDSPVDPDGLRAGIRSVTLPVRWAGPRLGQLLYHPLLMLAALLIRHDLWIESLTPPFSSSFLPLVTRRPVIALAQTLSARGMARKYRMPILVPIERFALGLYRYVIVLNPRDGDLVRTSNPAAAVSLIPNTVTAAGPPADRPATGSFCLYLGRLDVTGKGLDLLVDAYRAAGARTLPLVVAGAGIRTDEIRLAKLVRPLADRVRLVGYVHGRRKAELLHDAAFVVMPSREEAFGLVALEAMAYGKPVVHFGLHELSWIPDDCGVKVTPFDVAELTRAIEELSCDDARRDRLGRSARAYAERHNRATTDDAYATLVADILAAEGGHRSGRARRVGGRG
ncbi:glycosyltransferase family 4 protein [Actinoplanes sp. NPDC049316]|uniref:glycosyltransferase family 4 protein n=1 Tax=Actinoplanes sp. NPDC049316 TaxID=3154727 RepID=UPI003447C103